MQKTPLFTFAKLYAIHLIALHSISFVWVVIFSLHYGSQVCQTLLIFFCFLCEFLLIKKIVSHHTVGTELLSESRSHCTTFFFFLILKTAARRLCKIFKKHRQLKLSCSTNKMKCERGIGPPF